MFVVFCFVLMWFCIFFLFWIIGLALVSIIDISVVSIENRVKYATIFASILTVGVVAYGMFNYDQDSTIPNDDVNASCQCTCEYGCAEKRADLE